MARELNVAVLRAGMRLFSSSCASRQVISGGGSWRNGLSAAPQESIRT